MKYLFFLSVFAGIIVSCSESTKDKNAEQSTDDTDSTNVTFEERVKLHVQSQLQIPGSENYELKIYKEQLTEDGIEDAIITVNRLEFAMETAKKQKSVSKSAELDFWGEYNIIFYYDSELDKITPPLNFSSTPYRSLKVSFEHISSEFYKDPIIDYPLRNSEFRIFLPIINHAPKQVFQWKVFDGWGTDNLEAYCFSYEKGSYSAFKDIIISKASMKNIQPGDNYNKITPEITCGGEEMYRFFLNPRDFKYSTK